MIKGRCCFQSSFFVFLILSLFCVAPSFAGILKIKTQTTVQTTGDHLDTSVVLFNEGTVTAFNLQVHLELLGEIIDSKVNPQLDPSGSSTVVFEKSIEGIKEGTYPLTVSVDFHDANQYPFSALSGMTFFTGTNVNSDLAIVGEDITMGENGNIFMNIKNIGVDEKKILATIVLPREFSTPTPRIRFVLAPRSRKDLNFEIRNFSALAGASYPIFCYFEYDQGNIHHTVVYTAAIKIIKPKKNLFHQYRWLWIGLAGILIAALLAPIAKRRKKGKG